LTAWPLFDEDRAFPRIERRAATSADDPVVLNLRLGIVRQRAAIVPKRRIWCDSALGWAKDLSAIPGVAKG